MTSTPNRGPFVDDFTAPMVGARTGVAELVLVNAMIPNPGETPGAWWDNTGWKDARKRAAAAGGYSEEFDVNEYFLHDVPPEVASEGEPYQRPEANAVFASRCDFVEWPAVPSAYLAVRVTGSSRSSSSAEWRAIALGLSRMSCTADIFLGCRIRRGLPTTSQDDEFLHRQASDSLDRNRPKP
ncbi:hypothetical protein [Arthrobacter sp. efr-133-TYG-118]|uniref:hypothetical protein n=1 Tax=Arthrobacter sp. efr-133-TYG-118 TaxID=3040279 RepID=UPI00254B28AA|nr:hypothetical protein [Arthrobacter sp. efr-133-TYG-118]